MFLFSRMLGLRNMPFVTGRRFNWFTDILPVAHFTVKRKTHVTKGTSHLSCFEFC